MRTVLSLNRGWQFMKTASPTITKGEPVTLPHT